MALSAPRILEFVGEQDEISPKFTASVTYYKGSVLAILATGYVGKPTDTAAQFIAGVCAGEYSGVGADGLIRDDAYAMGSTALRGKIKRGKVWLPFSGAAITDVGLVFYLSDDGTLTKTAGSKTVGMVPIDFKTGYLLFDLRTYDRIA